jgi:hypothetical protein
VFRSTHIEALARGPAIMERVKDEDIIVRMQDEKNGNIYVEGVSYFGFTRWRPSSGLFDVAMGIQHPSACTFTFSSIAKKVHDFLDLEPQHVIMLTDWEMEPHRDMPAMAFRNGVLEVEFQVSFLHDEGGVLQLPPPDVVRDRLCEILIDNGLELLRIQRHQDFFSLEAEWLSEPDILTTVELQKVLSSCAATPFWPRQPTLRATLDYLRWGRLDSLVGTLEENEWFDAKRSVNLQSQQGKVEFAKDVAQFANAAGGVLVAGATNKKRPGNVEVLDKLHALDKTPGTASLPALMQSARDTVDAHVYPPIVGLEVESSTTRKGEIMYVYVPPQLPTSKPFIVSGESIEGGYSNTFFSIPRRRRDGNLPVSTKEIHHLLAGKLRDLG